MKRFYIPTSSLNFNNILSSESISPKAFYTARSFGYGRWVSVPENPFENSIVIYDQLCLFNRPVSDFEDHPMLVEIVLDEMQISTLVSIGEHVYLCNHTIYIDPFSSRILFFSEKDRQIALSMSVSSIESKLVQLYSKKIVTIGQPALTFPSIEASTEKQELNSVEINRDKRINRMKGLLYGYYIGAILSTSKEIVEKLNKAREIHNILAAILSSYDHRATEQQKNRLKYLYAFFQPEIPFLSKLSAIISEKSQFEAIVSLIRNEYGFIKGEIDVDRIIAQLLTSSIQSNVKNPVEDINNFIRQEEYSIIRNANLLSVNEGQVVVIDGILECLNIPNLSESDKILCKVWLNNVLSKDEYNGKISTFKDVLSDDVTIAAKEVCKTEWKGSYAEVTLNALRRHVRGDEFSHVWNDDIYSSMAAVIIRGDDWHNLLQYMQGKEMTDYRLAFAFYGALNGFANLPRDFTDILFNQVDRKYIAEVYKEIYGQLLGRSVIIPDKSLLPDVFVSLRPEENQYIEYDSASQPSVETSIMPSLKQLETSEEFINLMNILCKKCKGAQTDEKRYLELYIQNKGLNQAFVDAVSNDKLLNKGKKVQPSILRALQKLIKPEKKAKRKSPMVHAVESVNLFTDTCQFTGNFLSDYDFLVTNTRFVALMSSISCEWKEDLKWFIDAHSPSNKNYDYYKDKPTDNKSTIRQFGYFKNKKYKIAEEFLLSLYHVENL